MALYFHSNPIIGKCNKKQSFFVIFKFQLGSMVMSVLNYSFLLQLCLIILDSWLLPVDSYFQILKPAVVHKKSCLVLCLPSPVYTFRQWNILLSVSVSSYQVPTVLLFWRRRAERN